MSDGLTRGFRAQLTISMDAVLRRAVFEIMNIFENTVDDYQTELAHKGEEVAQLKIKLRTAELRLKDQVYGKDGGQEMIQPASQTQAPPEASTQTPSQPTAVSEVDVDAVPDDWCEPVNSEAVTIQDVSFCPSVKLRRLSIPLWNIPICKTEEGYCDIDAYPKTRTSRRLTSLNNLKILLEKVPVPNLKQESPDPAQLKDLKRSKRMSAGEVKKQAVKKKKKDKTSAAKPRSTEVNTAEKNAENVYSCKICNEIFESDSGLRVHERFHRKCLSCNKMFESKNLLSRHKVYCRKIKMQFAATTASPPKLFHEGENTLAPSKKPPTVKESTPSLDSKLSTKKDASIKKFACPHCEKTFANPFLLKQHLSIHFKKKLTPCSMCSQMFRSSRGMRIHRAKAHEKKMNPRDRKEDLAWTEPVEETDNETQDLISIHSKSNQQSNPSNKEKQNSVMNVKLETTGNHTQKGSTCLLCLKTFKSKDALIEHMDIHK